MADEKFSLLTPWPDGTPLPTSALLAALVGTTTVKVSLAQFIAAMPGTGTPAPTLGALNFTPASGISTATAPGIVVGLIGGRTSGGTVAVSDSRLEISGNNVVVGPSTLPQGTLSFSVTETLTGATNTPRTTTGFSISVSAASTADWRVQFTDVQTSDNDAAFRTAMLATRSNGAYASKSVPAGGTLWTRWTVPAVGSKRGAIWYYPTGSLDWSIAMRQSFDGGATWTTLPAPVKFAPSGDVDTGTGLLRPTAYLGRGQAAYYPQGAARIVELGFTNADTTNALGLDFGLYDMNSPQKLAIGTVGNSRSLSAVTVASVRARMRFWTPGCDPMVLTAQRGSAKVRAVVDEMVKPFKVLHPDLTALIQCQNGNGTTAGRLSDGADPPVLDTAKQAEFDAYQDLLDEVTGTGWRFFTGGMEWKNFTGEALSTAITNQAASEDVTGWTRFLRFAKIKATPALAHNIDPATGMLRMDFITREAWDPLINSTAGGGDGNHYGTYGNTQAIKSIDPALRDLLGLDPKSNAQLLLEERQAAGTTPADIKANLDVLAGAWGYIFPGATTAQQSARQAIRNGYAALTLEAAYTDPANVTLPQNDGALLAFDFAHPDYQALNSAGDPVLSDGMVGRVLDRVGNRVMEQTATAAKPIRDTGSDLVNGRSMLRGRTNTQFNYIDSGAYLAPLNPAAAPFAVETVVKVNDGANFNKTHWQIHTTSGTNLLRLVQASGGLSLRLILNASTVLLQEPTTSPPVAGTPYYVAVVYDGTDIVIYRNGSETARVAFAKALWDVIGFRGLGGGGSWQPNSQGDLNLYPSAFDATKRARRWAWARAKWGLS